MTKFFMEAVRLSQQQPLPSDIIDQLDKYYEIVPEEEKDDFLWLYEAVELETNLLEI
jgi:hypothetical protein